MARPDLSLSCFRRMAHLAVNKRPAITNSPQCRDIISLEYQGKFLSNLVFS